MARATLKLAWQRTLIDAWRQRGLLAWLLTPVALIFGTLAAFRRKLYAKGFLRTQSVGVPVIVVGNVIAGGSGKTPVVLILVQHMKELGLQVGVVSRGYGRHTTDCHEVHVDSLVRDVGDEPAFIKRTTSAPVFVAKHRFEAACSLLSHYPDTQVIISDDGLQHLALHRDLEICVFDDRGIGNGFLLPAGPLREPWPRPVDLVLHTGAHPVFAGFTAQRRLAKFALKADGCKVALNELTGSGNKPILAVAAVAKPEEFFAMLQVEGLHLTRTIGLPDHHDFADWRSSDYKHYTVICTEKDAVKLWQYQPDALAIPLTFRPESGFFDELNRLLSDLPNIKLSRKLSLRHGHTTS